VHQRIAIISGFSGDTALAVLGRVKVIMRSTYVRRCNGDRRFHYRKDSLSNELKLTRGVGTMLGSHMYR